MQLKKTLPAIGVVLAFIVLSVHPLVAQQDVPESTVIPLDCRIIDELGVSSLPLSLSEEELDTFFSKLSEFTDQLGSEQSYLSLLRVFTQFFDNTDGDSILEQQLFQTIGDLHLNLIGKRVFVISFGHGIQLNPLRKSQINVLRPSYLFWFYPGVSHKLFADKTLIIDPSPFHVKVLDGGQIGIMRRFVGIYIFIPGTTSRESTIFFMGYAYKALGLDLSPN